MSSYLCNTTLALFSGADVYSVTVIVAAFMAGLGCGNITGGYIADRVSFLSRMALFAASELAIALFAFLSKPLYYDILFLKFNYLAKSPSLLAGILFLSLLWPTFFMGMSLPLLSRTLTRTIDTASSMVGALYGINTLGAAVGSFAAIWLIIRTFGLEKGVQIGVVLNLFCAFGAVIVLYFLRKRSSSSTTPREEKRDHLVQPAIFSFATWTFIYTLSGFIALSLEIVWFRMLGVMLKSPTFAFGSLLAVYLLGLAGGTFLATGWAKRSKDPAGVFFILQTGITIYAGLSLVIFLGLVDSAALLRGLWEFFGGDDYLEVATVFASMEKAIAGQRLSQEDTAVLFQFLNLYATVPLVLIFPPTLLMGLSFPFLQKVIQTDMAFLGRRVGWLQTANIMGSMLGAIVVGWVFLGVLGTAGTLITLIGLGGIFPLLLVRTRLAQRPFLKAVAFATVAVSVSFIIWLMPPASVLWAKFHGTVPEKIIFAEDGSGLSVLKDKGENTTVYANGAGQSWLPYGKIHTKLGVTAALLHLNPKEIAVIGLGSGDTAFSIGGRPETEEITCIEIIAPQLYTLELYDRVKYYSGLKSLLEDRRIRHVFGDGRAFVMQGNKKYDIIEADALRPNGIYSGNLYSYEYFTLLRDHLKEGGLAVSWAPTTRVVKTFVKAFPYVLLLRVGPILVGSNGPIEFSVDAIKDRLNEPFTREYYEKAGIDVVTVVEELLNSKPVMFTPEYDRTGLKDINSDLFPKDEYLVGD